jgi:hypothetical protein
MKKNIFLVLLLLLTIVCAYGQNASPIDLVLLLDTSSTMSSSYENVNNYITGGFLNEFLRVGDTFHLIVFSSNSRLDVARRISGVGDVETIIGRMLLQYPIENGSNISSALNYAEQYITTLPVRQKKIVLVSVGASDTGNLVNASKQRLSSKNSTLDFIQVTPGKALSNLPKSGRPAGAKITTTTTTTTTTKPASSGGTQGASSGSSGQTQSKTNSGTGTTGGTAAAGATAGTAAKTDTGGTTAGTSTTGASTGTGTTGSSATGTTAGTGTGTSAAGASSGTNTTGASAGTGATGATAAGSSAAEGTNSVSQGQQGQNAVSGKSADQQSTGTSPNADKSSGGKNAKSNLSAEERAKNRAESAPAVSLPFILLVSILTLLLLGIILFLVSRKLGSSPNRVMTEAASTGGKTPRDNTKRDTVRDTTRDNIKRDNIRDTKRDNTTTTRDTAKRDNTKFADHSKELAKYASVPNRRSSPYDVHPLKPDTHKSPAINPSGPLLLNLFVEDQNTAIGKRNIHSLKSGYSLTVGGGKTDDYMIFLVPIPPHIGEIHRSGSSLTFVPKKPKYFPDIGANEVRDCINKTIRIISDKQFEMRFRFEMYEDPLIALNRVLMSVKIPG